MGDTVAGYAGDSTQSLNQQTATSTNQPPPISTSVSANNGWGDLEFNNEDDDGPIIASPKSTNPPPLSPNAFALASVVTTASAASASSKSSTGSSAMKLGVRKQSQSKVDQLLAELSVTPALPATHLPAAQQSQHKAFETLQQQQPLQTAGDVEKRLELERKKEERRQKIEALKQQRRQMNQ